MNIQYIPGESRLYRINPIVKGLICFILILFFTLSKLGLAGLAVLIAAISLLFYASGVPQFHIWFSLKRIAVLLILVGAVQGFRGNEFNAAQAGLAMLRIIGVFVCAGFYLTLSPQSELMYFWENLFKPFSLIGLPSRELALVMVIAVRFFPVILGEIDRIRMSQIARGAKLRKTNIFSSAASLMPLLIPTLSQAIIRAGELAEAMEARAYGAFETRTRYINFKLGFVDIFSLFILALTLTFITFTGI